MKVIIEKVKSDHWESIREIYIAGIETGNATFETTAPNWRRWKESHILKCSLVAKQDQNIVGWAALSSVSNRCVYSGVAENSIYIHPEYKGQGIGNLLMQSLIRCLEKEGFWMIQTGIFPENKTSVAIHRKHGFRIVGQRERIGKMNGVWRDVLFLERRSKIIGVN